MRELERNYLYWLHSQSTSHLLKFSMKSLTQVFCSLIYWLVYFKIARQKQKLLVVDKTAKRCSKVTEHLRVGIGLAWPQDSVVIIWALNARNYSVNIFFSLFTIVHLWLTIIRCQEPINGLPKMSLWSHFFSQKKWRQCLKEDRILKMFRTFETGCSQRIIFT